MLSPTIYYFHHKIEKNKHEGGILMKTRKSILCALMAAALMVVGAGCGSASSKSGSEATTEATSKLEATVDTASLMSEANEHFTEVFYGTFFASACFCCIAKRG